MISIGSWSLSNTCLCVIYDSSKSLGTSILLKGGGQNEAGTEGRRSERGRNWRDTELKVGAFYTWFLVVKLDLKIIISSIYKSHTIGEFGWVGGGYLIVRFGLFCTFKMHIKFIQNTLSYLNVHWIKCLTNWYNYKYRLSSTTIPYLWL